MEGKQDALEAELGANRGRRNSVLPSASLGDDAGLADAASEEDLTDSVVDLSE